MKILSEVDRCPAVKPVTELAVKIFADGADRDGKDGGGSLTHSRQDDQRRASKNQGDQASLHHTSTRLEQGHARKDAVVVQEVRHQAGS